MQLPEQRYYSPEEYLEFEVNSEEKHEYIDGQVILQVSEITNHNTVVGNFGANLLMALKRQPYQVFILRQRLWIPQKRMYVYPDVMAIADQLEYAEGRRDTLINPVLIAEVLSKSTKSYDRDEKFAAYRTIPNFQEYILIDQYKIHVEQYYKTDNNKWIFSEYEDANLLLNLSSIPCQVLLGDIYDQVDFSVEA
ncbi:Uma2 family endonuclease [Nostoc sp. FACHB-87]|uniref:Uma2 family endonuclease n=1 Tax=Nostocaceae TaxID=1162 RepID=UPI0016823121|nr:MULTISPECIES: Uma2 family endonuclease [Nostocaceae]MBD2458152.1 Uma2 family endonuclease [Nostoc sp. FACHB-87]MBD2478973.1 Uma2 family endonuclease [Anabaena sp. FACHB-83]